MSPKTAHAVAVIIGIFCIVMIAAAVLNYGWYAIITMIVGLFVFAAVIGAILGIGGKHDDRNDRGKRE